MKLLLDWPMRVAAILSTLFRVDRLEGYYIFVRLVNLIATIFYEQSTLFNYKEVQTFCYLPLMPLRCFDVTPFW